MLGLRLRDEFLGAQMPGTAITLRARDNSGAAQRAAEDILAITYPTADVRIALRAVSAGNAGRPVVLFGERGRGKSHIMAVLHHAVASPEAVEAWLRSWGPEIGGEVPALRRGYLPISEPVHEHEYPFLWDLLFDRHPRGQYYQGQFESLDQAVPPKSLLANMFSDQPVCLILDELQTWYVGLPEEDRRTGLRPRDAAFNFVQMLSELARDRPDLLIFVVSVRDNQNEVFRQVHRQTPVLVDFQGPTAREDRRRLALHRLFANRRNIPEADIAALCAAHAAERFRLLHPDRPEADRARIQGEVFACWPYSPELLDLLEDHILMASAAQETRDLIRILAQVFKSRGEHAPVITPADFFVDGESDEVQTLVDAIATQSGQEKLREIARRNLEETRASGVHIPNARELVSAIWMRSMSPAPKPGGTPAMLQVDVTRREPLDDNAFQAELALLVENSINIQGDETPGGRLRFGLEENPRSRVRAFARNHKLWRGEGEGGGAAYPGRDLLHIRKTLKDLFVPETASPPCRVIVLGPNWRDDPWSDAEEGERPERWAQDAAPALLAIPEPLAPEALNAALGAWLARHVPKRRNTARFLLMRADAPGLFADEDLLFVARCAFLCSKAGWGGTDRTYAGLSQEFDRPLRARLKEAFTAFAVLRLWDFQRPERCVFDTERIAAQDTSLPREVEAAVQRDLFDPGEFAKRVLEHAKAGGTAGALLDELAEAPPPGAGEAIPWLGETRLYERILALAAEGDIALNVDGAWIVRRAEDEDREAALRRIQTRAFRSGQEMRRVRLALPGAVGGDALPGPTPPRPEEKTAVPPASPTPLPGLPFPSPSPAEDGAGGNVAAEPEGTFTTPKAPAGKRRKTEEPAGGINLSGRFEAWGVAPQQRIETAALTFSGLTARQIQTILQGIPSAFKATLEIAWQEDDEP